MEWISQNWIWVLVGVAFVAMHMFGHGSHGGHGGHGGGGARKTGRDSSERSDDDAPPPHRH